MARVRTYLVLFLLVITASCLPLDPGDRSPDIGEDRGELNPPSLVASPTPQSFTGTPLVAILSPLQVDGQRGRLYAVAQVNGEPKLVTLDARTGALLSVWDTPGQLALDSARDRLVVDQGNQGVALLVSTTGESQSIITIPVQDDPPSPQVNSQSGLVYAFRESTIHIIDPAIRSVVRTVPISVKRMVCDTPSGDAPIYRTAYDPQADRLYLTFVTYTCTPWVSATIVTYDASEMVEIGRTEVDINYQIVAYDRNLYGTSVSRLGPMVNWAWDGERRWFEKSREYEGDPAGMAVDTGRKLIYDAVGESVLMIDPKDAARIGEKRVPLLTDGRLAGFDPEGDTLYFVTDTGRLYLWPAANLFSEGAPPMSAPSPLPPLAVRSLVISPKSTLGYTTAALLQNEDCPVNGGRLYLMTAHGGWYPAEVTPNGECEAVATVAFSPHYAQDSLIIAAVNEPPTIVRSIDTGRSWNEAETSFPAGTQFSAVLFSPAYANDQTLYTLTSTGLFYRSRDGGRVWQLLSQRLDRVTIVLASDSRVHLYGTKDSRVLHSKNDGETWVETGPTPQGENVTLLAAARSIEQEPILYAFTTGGRFARSTDGGVTWIPIMETSPAAVQVAIAADVAAEQRPVFLLHDRNVVASYDGMTSIWTATAVEEANQFRPTAIALAPDFATSPYLYLGTADGQIIRIRADARP